MTLTGRRIRLVAFLVFVPLVPSVAQRTGIGSTCWRLSFTPWQPSPGRDSTLYQPLPDTVRLSTERFDTSYFKASRRPSTPPALLSASLDSLRAYWRPLGSDSIELWLPTWWSTGIQAHLRMVGDSMRGRAWVYVDYEPYNTPYADVRARRCGAA